MMENRKFPLILGASLLILCAVFLFLFFPFRHQDTGPARVLFAGTRDDADCAIILNSSSCIMIDTGEEQDAEHILDLLEQEQVERIDCMILTHPDKDHIGGAPAILDQYPVDEIVVPLYSGSKPEYTALLEHANVLGSRILVLTSSCSYSFDDLNIRIWPPMEKHYKKDNNYSLATLIQHGDINLFFAGDAQKKRMKEILTYSLPPIDLYKVSYHGRDLTTGARLIEKITPELAVVTARAPEPEIQEALDSVHARIFCTVGQDITLISDGKELQPGEPVPLPQTQP